MASGPPSFVPCCAAAPGCARQLHPSNTARTVKPCSPTSCPTATARPPPALNAPNPCPLLQTPHPHETALCHKPCRVTHHVSRITHEPRKLSGRASPLHQFNDLTIQPI